MSHQDEILCGNASDSLYLTFKGGCRGTLNIRDCYRCTGCGGRFHKDCILKHFELEKEHDWGRQEERKNLEAAIIEAEKRAELRGRIEGFDKALDVFEDARGRFIVDLALTAFMKNERHRYAAQLHNLNTKEEES